MGEMAADQLLAGMAGEPALGFVDAQEAAVAIDLDDADGGVLGRRAEPALACPQGRLAGGKLLVRRRHRGRDEVGLPDAAREGVHRLPAPERAGFARQPLDRPCDAPPEPEGEQERDREQHRGERRDEPERAPQRRLDDALRHADEGAPARELRLREGAEHRLALEADPAPGAIFARFGGAEAFGRHDAEVLRVTLRAGDDAAVAVEHGRRPGRRQVLLADDAGDMGRLERDRQDMRDALVGEHRDAHAQHRPVRGRPGEEVLHEGQPGLDHLLVGVGVGALRQRRAPGDAGVDELLAGEVADDDGIVLRMRQRPDDLGRPALDALEVPGAKRRGAGERKARRLEAGELAVDGGDDLLRRGAGLFLVLHLLGPGELPDEDDGEQKHRHQERRAIGHQVLAKRTIALSHHRLERRTLPPTLDGGTGHERRQSPARSRLCARRRSRGRCGPGGAAGGASL